MDPGILRDQRGYDGHNEVDGYRHAELLLVLLVDEALHEVDDQDAAGRRDERGHVGVWELLDQLYPSLHYGPDAGLPGHRHAEDLLQLAGTHVESDAHGEAGDQRVGQETGHAAQAQAGRYDHHDRSDQGHATGHLHAT